MATTQFDQWLQVIAAPAVKPDFDAVLRHLCSNDFLKADLAKWNDFKQESGGKVNVWFNCARVAGATDAAAARRRRRKSRRLRKSTSRRLADSKAKTCAGLTKNMFGQGASYQCIWTRPLKPSCYMFRILEHSFDGLGHVMWQLSSEMEKALAQGYVDPYHYLFPEHIGRSAIYLRDVRWNDKSYTSLYCHEAQLTKIEKFRTGQDFLHSQFECFYVPDLDKWFNLRSLLPVSSCERVKLSPLPSPKYSESFVRQKYWEMHRANHEICGTKKWNNGKRTLIVSVHLRLGDLAGMQDSIYNKKLEYFQRRKRESIEDFKEAMNIVSDVTKHSNCTVHGMRVFVLSDSGFWIIKELFEKHGLSMIKTRDVQEKTAKHTIAKTTMPGLPELEFLTRINPLVALHCLADADILITGRGSFFARVAQKLNKGYQLVTEDVSPKKRDKLASAALKHLDIKPC